MSRTPNPMIPRSDASKIQAGDVVPDMRPEDMRFMYWQLMEAASGTVKQTRGRDNHDIGHATELLKENVKKAFEKARYAVEINGRYLEDLAEFKETCEATVGLEPIDEELQRKIAILHQTISTDTNKLMALRRRVPEKQEKLLAMPQPEYIAPPITIQEPKLNEKLVCTANKSLHLLNQLETRLEELKQQKLALEYTI